MKAQTVPDSRGLVPAIHVLLSARKSWMPGTKVYTRAGHRPDPSAGHDVES
jgi:hypothetical protein